MTPTKNTTPCGAILIRPFIDGVFVDPVDCAAISNINPANGRTIGEIPVGSAADVERAVRSARAAFERGTWSDTSVNSRKTVLLAVASLIEEQSESLAQLDMLEMGMPISNAREEAAIAAGFFRFCAEAMGTLRDHVLPSEASSIVMSAREPLGVIGAITPWNYPLILAAAKIAPAIASGSSIIVKPSEIAPSSALRLAGLLLEAGLPPGIVNVVPGLGTTVGQALALHMDVDKLTFTGSTATGGKLMECAGRSNLKRLTLECGGKSPVIVFADAADLDIVAHHVVQGFCANQGQLCVAGTRLLAHEGIVDQLSTRVVDILSSIRVREPHLSDCSFGPLASHAQLEKVMRYAAVGQEAGARLLAGGRRVLEESGGYYFEPTIFSEVDPTSVIAQEEIFGPILAVTTFSTPEEAIAQANGTPYGLAARLWTRDFEFARNVARKLKSGIVDANITGGGGAGAGFAASSEPRKMSGFGVEGGLEGMLAYTARKSVSFNFA